MLQPPDTHSSPGAALIALGSNLSFQQNTPRALLQQALEKMEQKGLSILRISAFYSTPCFPAGTGPDYVNAVALIHTKMTAQKLLSHLHEVENALGRQRLGRWQARVIDLDLLAYDQQILPDQKTFDHWQQLPLEKQKQIAPQELILPHPRIQDRAFVLVPLAEIAPDWTHPVFGKTARQLRDELDPADIAQVNLL